jgi:hypothetical protein
LRAHIDAAGVCNIIHLWTATTKIRTARPGERRERPSGTAR